MSFSFSIDDPFVERARAAAPIGLPCAVGDLGPRGGAECGSLSLFVLAGLDQWPGFLE